MPQGTLGPEGWTPPPIQGGIPRVVTDPLTGEMVQIIAVVTQAQYDAIVTKDAKTLYIIKG